MSSCEFKKTIFSSEAIQSSKTKDYICDCRTGREMKENAVLAYCVKRCCSRQVCSFGYPTVMDSWSMVDA